MSLRNYFRQAYRLVFPMLYSGKKFKLFVNVAIDSIPPRMLALASSADYFSSFVRPIPIRAPFGRSMLVVAPHQDDETIGCGGAIALQVRSGDAAAVVLLTDGADGCEDIGMTRREMADMRNEESRRAAAVIGMDTPIFLNHTSLTADFATIVTQLREEILRTTADSIFIPFVLDAHEDHRTANFILAEALKDIQWEIRIFQYEVWGLCIPNVILVIDDVMDDKLKMLNAFVFANSALDYTNSTKGLNMFHSRMLAAGTCKYAERFFEMPRSAYIELVDRMRASLKAHQ